MTRAIFRRCVSITVTPSAGLRGFVLIQSISQVESLLPHVLGGRNQIFPKAWRRPSEARRLQIHLPKEECTDKEDFPFGCQAENGTLARKCSYYRNDSCIINDEATLVVCLMHEYPRFMSAISTSGMPTRSHYLFEVRLRAETGEVSLDPRTFHCGQLCVRKVHRRN